MVPPRPSNKRKLLQLPYPENLMMTLLEGIVETIEVTPDRQAGLNYALSWLQPQQQPVQEIPDEDMESQVSPFQRGLESQQ